MAVSEAQQATRRRALGRKLIKYASDLAVIQAAINGSTDLEFLTDGENAALAKQVKGMASIAKNFNTLGGKLDA